MSFNQPKSDTCKRCDTDNIMLKDQTLNQDQRDAVQKERELHHIKAAKGYNMPKNILENADDDVLCWLSVWTLQLSTSIAFYKKKMWTLNFCIHKYRSDMGHMFLCGTRQQQREEHQTSQTS